MVSSTVETPSRRGLVSQAQKRGGRIALDQKSSIFRKSGHRFSAENVTRHRTESMNQIPLKLIMLSAGILERRHANGAAQPRHSGRS
jgi:hypothetical protein